MSVKNYPMTALGFKQLQEELRRLENEERPKVIRDISEARAHGDLSENAEYKAAKEKQGFIEGKIAEIRSKIAFAEIIDLSKIDPSKVQFGATVTIRDAENNRQMRYTIVGEDEADFEQNRISVSTPIARALIGKNRNDEVEVEMPNGLIRYFTIEQIAYDYYNIESK